jgi:hypothetical protein
MSVAAVQALDLSCLCLGLAAEVSLSNATVGL